MRWISKMGVFWYPLKPQLQTISLFNENLQATLAGAWLWLSDCWLISDCLHMTIASNISLMKISRRPLLELGCRPLSGWGLSPSWSYKSKTLSIIVVIIIRQIIVNRHRHHHQSIYYARLRNHTKVNRCQSSSSSSSKYLYCSPLWSNKRIIVIFFD